MANKVALAAALLMALVAVASATTYTTTVTTTNYDEERSQRHEQCSQQLQGRQFRSCQRFLGQRSSEEEEEEVIEMSTGGIQHHERYLQECCEQLKEMDRHQCGCEAIRHAMRQAQQGGGSSRGYHTGQSERIYEQARSLPRMCGLREQQCRFNVVFV